MSDLEKGKNKIWQNKKSCYFCRPFDENGSSQSSERAGKTEGEVRKKLVKKFGSRGLSYLPLQAAKSGNDLRKGFQKKVQKSEIFFGRIKKPLTFATPNETG